MKMDYKAPRITVVELDAGNMICISQSPMGSAYIESFKEEDFEW